MVAGTSGSDALPPLSPHVRSPLGVTSASATGHAVIKDVYGKPRQVHLAKHSACATSSVFVYHKCALLVNLVYQGIVEAGRCACHYA